MKHSEPAKSHHTLLRMPCKNDLGNRSFHCTTNLKNSLWKINSLNCEDTQSCPTLCNPMVYSLLGSSIHGIFQARVLEWVAISFSRRSSQPRDQTQVSHIAGGRLYHLSHQGSPTYQQNYYPEYLMAILGLNSRRKLSGHCDGGRQGVNHTQEDVQATQFKTTSPAERSTFRNPERDGVRS